MKSRREFLAAVGGAVGAAWLTANVSDLAASGAHAGAASLQTMPFTVLTASQAADLEAFAAQIIPSDGTPGAREARVIHFIDHSLATFAKDQHKAVVEGWQDLQKRSARQRRGTSSFAALTDADQKAVIARAEKDNARIFHILRAATVMGMFANPEYGGNFQKAGWRMIGFQDRFSWAAPFGAYDR